MIIRNARMNDTEAFWQMQYELDKETKYMMYEPYERTKDMEQLKRLINNSVEDSDFLLVAEDEGAIVGYISAQRGIPNRIKHSAYIVVGIREAFQGKGIGSRFFKELDLWASKKNITRLELTVMCPNTRGRHLYEKNGFVIEGIKKRAMIVDGEYVDEFYMAKLL